MALPDEKPLEGWKAIAQHFNRSVKTAQRWQQDSLPVHRHPALGVVAYPSELDAWLQERAKRSEAQTPTSSITNDLQEQHSGTSIGGIAAQAIQTPAVDKPRSMAAGAAALPHRDGPGSSSVQELPRSSVTAALSLAFGLILLAVAILLVGAVGKRTPLISPEALTNDGYVKHGPLWTDGKHIYFTEKIDEATRLASVSVHGGEVIRIEVPGVPEPVLMDGREPGPEFLLYGIDLQGRGYLWDWELGGTPRPITPSNGTNGGSWVTASSFVNTTIDGRLQVVDHDRIKRTFSLPGIAYWPRWSAARGLLRFSLNEIAADRQSLWQMSGLDSTPERIPALPPDPNGGDWGQDSRLFAFVARSQRSRDLWIAREPHVQGPGRLIPTKLTDGPFTYQSVAPAPDGRSVFAIGTEERGELVRYEAANKRFVPFLEGMPGIELDYSRDGQWLTYVKYPERSLWKSRADGSEPVRLTSSPMVAIEPHWSPDGSQIAFVGEYVGHVRRIYLIGSNGGTAQEISPHGPPQGVPTWSREGLIVFGDLLSNGSAEPMSVHILDPSNHTLTKLPSSDGLWTPRWSPNGAFISALTTDYRQLKLYDCRARIWQDLAEFDNIDHPHWSADSMYLYFRGVTLKKGSMPELRAIYRFSVRNRMLEKVADLDRFPAAQFEWFGITPSGTPLGLRGVSVQNIYSIPVP